MRPELTAGRADESMTAMSSVALTLSPELVRWLSDALQDPGPFTVQPLSGGNSNETLLLQSPAGARILRRPPSATIDPSAHSMAREYRVLTALDGRTVPAPRPLAYCDDPDVAPAGVLVMERSAGVSLTTALPAGFAGDARAVGYAIVDALAALHTVDWRAAGLEGFGRVDGFLERQVPRWRKQHSRYAVRELELFEPVAQWLESNLPPGFEPGILHGDFHADNCLVTIDAPTRVAAIVDFEMTTIGDPLLDLGLVLAFWGDARPAAPAMPTVQGFSRGADAPDRQELAERYAAASGRSIDHLPFYLTLAFWKLAAIVEGAYAHYLDGNLDSDYGRDLAHDVPALLSEAAGFAGIS
jgi:aminoglycoside phosphotransferase (APT) family kinase protein